MKIKCIYSAIRGLIMVVIALHTTTIYAADVTRNATSNHHNHHNHHAKHFSLTPANIMGDHNHGRGEWMASYSYGVMHMQGNRHNSNDISTSAVLNNFIVAPTEMTMQMHMLGLMYGISDQFTLMGMLPYKLLSMKHVNRMGTRFTTKSEGVGDISLTGIYTLYEHESSKLILNAGISLPTGSIDKRDNTPMAANQKLPYPMQLGSGTYDMLPGITYINQQDTWSWGSQLNAVIRLGDNSNHYTLGNQYTLTTWAARQLTDYVSASVRFDGKIWGDISGEDAELNPAITPTARTDIRGGERIDLLVGFNIFAPQKAFTSNKLAIEAGIPIYQRLDGPQLATDYRLTIGWQVTF